MTDYYADTYIKPAPFVPVISGPEPFSLSDAYVLSGQLPSHTEVMSAAPIDPSSTDAWGLSFTGVMDAFVEPPQSHAKGRIRPTRVPVWALVLVFAGLALIGTSLSLWFMILPALEVIP